MRIDIDDLRCYIQRQQAETEDEIENEVMRNPLMIVWKLKGALKAYHDFEKLLDWIEEVEVHT